MSDSNILQCHRSPVALFSRFLLVFLPLSALYTVLSLIAADPIEPSVLSPAALKLAYRILVIGLTLEMIRLYFNNLYVFGRNRVVQFRGRVSLRLSRVSIAYKDIRDIGIRQSPVGRILHYGTLTFGTSSRDGYEIEMADIPFPRSVMAHVQEHMDRLARQRFDEEDEPRLLPAPQSKPIPEQRQLPQHTGEAR